MAHLVLTRAFLRPAATAAMHCQPENPSSKWIASTDNKRSNLDDDYSQRVNPMYNVLCVRNHFAIFRLI